MIVAKFGGSSVKDANAMRACSSVVAQSEDIGIVIISATYNTTNQLEEMARTSISNLARAQELLQENQGRHQKLAQDLHVWEFVMAPMEEIYLEASHFLQSIHDLSRISLKIDMEKMDALYAIGERISSLLFFAHLKNKFPEREVHLADARQVIITDSHFSGANPDTSAIAKKWQELWGKILRKPHTLIVTQGFIGSDLQGRTTVLGREGSDYTATLVGEAIGASEVQIWTDVPGVAVADPKLFPHARFIDKLSYEQAALMAQLGSKVLFANTLAPAIRTGMPVFVGHTSAPKQGGTWIRSQNDKAHKLSQWPLTLALMDRPKQIANRFESAHADIVVVSLVGGEEAERVLIAKSLTEECQVKILEKGTHHLSLAVELASKSRAIVSLLNFFDRPTRLV